METKQPKSTRALAPKAFDRITQTAGEPIVRRCCVCLAKVVLPAGAYQPLDVWCDKCEAERTQTAGKRQREELHQKRETVVPVVFRSTERGKLPFPVVLDRALAWQFSGKGILLYGPTGSGKSRIAWEIIKREMHRTVEHVNVLKLMRYPSLLMGSDATASRFVDSLVKPDLLLLDDVFKAKPTERVEELLFAVLEERSTWARPCIVTLNDSSDSLVTRLSEDRGPALIRRLKEHCDMLYCGPAPA